MVLQRPGGCSYSRQQALSQPGTSFLRSGDCLHWYCPQTLFLFNLRDLFIPMGQSFPRIAPFLHASKLQFSKHCPGSQCQQQSLTYCECTFSTPPPAPRIWHQRRCWLKHPPSSGSHPRGPHSHTPACVFAHCIYDFRNSPT